MLGKHLTGPNAGARKYDVITALGAFALGADRTLQRRILRLITLMTARYNWQRDELTVGRTEIAKLWAVDERTVKRDLSALKALGIVKVKRPGARGRVTAYAIDLAAIMDVSATSWGRVGPDFSERMHALAGGQPGEPPKPNTVVPFPRAAISEPRETSGGQGPWLAILERLELDQPARCRAWFEPLRFIDIRDGQLSLRAPSDFHAEYVSTHFEGEILIAARKIAGVVRSLKIAGHRL